MNPESSLPDALAEMRRKRVHPDTERLDKLDRRPYDCNEYKTFAWPVYKYKTIREAIDALPEAES